MPQSFAIVPAAGRSERMGQPKLLLPWGDEGFIIDVVLTAWTRSLVDRIVVVLRPDDDELEDACRPYDADVVRPDKPPPQMQDSVRCGLKWIADRYSPSDEDCWLLAPADLPTLSPAAIDEVLQAHQPANPTIIVPLRNGRRAHPVLFPWALAAAVDQLGRQEGVNRLLQRFPVRELAVGAAPLDDLDTPDAYRRLHDRCHPPNDQT